MLTNTLGVPLGTAKAMVFKKRGLAAMAPDELLDRVRTVADVVGVTTDQAIEMVTIQPGLLFDTQVRLEQGQGQGGSACGWLGAGLVGVCRQLHVNKGAVAACRALWVALLPRSSCCSSAAAWWLDWGARERSLAARRLYCIAQVFALQPLGCWQAWPVAAAWHVVGCSAQCNCGR